MPTRSPLPLPCLTRLEIPRQKPERTANWRGWFPALLVVVLTACSGEVRYNQVEVVGFAPCSAGIYTHPVMLELTGNDASIKYTVANSRRNVVSIRNDRKTSWRVRAGVCLNEVTTSSYRCEEPTTWYYDQKFTYDPKAPQKLAVPTPPDGQVCKSL